LNHRKAAKHGSSRPEGALNDCPASLQNNPAVLDGTPGVSWPELTSFLAEAGARHDRDGSFPFDSLGRRREACLLGLTVPRSLGGQGQGLAAAAEAVDHVATGCASTALVFAMQLTKQAAPRARACLSGGLPGPDRARGRAGRRLAERHPHGTGARQPRRAAACRPPRRAR
jgi:alkylation response protein AidB-like acyl-CoA dehydrogenase